MEKVVTKKSCQHHKLTYVQVTCFFLIVILSVVLSYELVYTRQRFEEQRRINDEIQYKMDTLSQLCQKRQELMADVSHHKSKREVLSSTDDKLSGLLRGAPGPVGPPGQDGRDGRPGLPGNPGKDFTSLALLRDVVKQNVDKEWTKLSQSLPVPNGEVFTRWGRTSCPDTSKLIYKGAMAGPDWRSTGGGSNYQCMPDDPEYFSTALPNVPASTLRAAIYDQTLGKYGKQSGSQRIPCAVCETNQRGTKLMMPAKNRCPSSEWTVEYQGYLVSEIEHSHNSPTAFVQNRGTGSYVCVDEKAEPLPTDKAGDWSGPVLYPVAADCSSHAKLECPPYRTDRTALSCVVCTK